MKIDFREYCESPLYNSRKIWYTVVYSGQYRTKIVRQMRRQIFRQMKQKAE